MKLAYTFIADSAQITSDRKIWVLGGDFDTIWAPDFPVIHPMMALVVKVEVEPLECERKHRLRVALIDADGQKLQPEVNAEFQPARNPRYPHRSVGVSLVLNLIRTEFPKRGDYAFHILVDDIELGKVRLYMEPMEQKQVLIPGTPDDQPERD